MSAAARRCRTCSTRGTRSAISPAASGTFTGDWLLVRAKNGYVIVWDGGRPERGALPRVFGDWRVVPTDDAVGETFKELTINNEDGAFEEHNIFSKDYMPDGVPIDAFDNEPPLPELKFDPPPPLDMKPPLIPELDQPPG